MWITIGGICGFGLVLGAALWLAKNNGKKAAQLDILKEKAKRLARNNNCPFVDNELPYGRAEQGHPVIVDYFYHEEVRGSENTGKRWNLKNS